MLTAQPEFGLANVQSLEAGMVVLGRQLGKGSYGVVYRAVLKATGEACAVKELTPNMFDAHELTEVEQEIEMLIKYSKHNNIARFYGAYRVPNLTDSLSLW
jgi:serine/threonine protein kinase